MYYITEKNKKYVRILTSNNKIVNKIYFAEEKIPESKKNTNGFLIKK